MRLVRLLVPASALAALAAFLPSGATAAEGPCDILTAAGNPCVAAHSTVRALYGTYSGKLYQVRRSKDNTTRDILTLSPGGAADGPSQDVFCAGTSCVTTAVFDQSGKGNDLWYQGSSVVPGSPQSSPAVATTESFNLAGHKVYSLYIKPGNSYWRDGHTTGIPTGAAPEAMYMVTSGTHYNGGCCFDYGNSETTRKADAAGAMDAIYFGKSCWFAGGTYQCNTGSGPWVQADLEWGLFAWNSSKTWNPKQVSFSVKYVTAMLKNNGTTRFALKGGNAQQGDLTNLYEGALPGGFNPMKKQGAIVLGSGGDCCKPDGGANQSEGTFYEGAMVTGYPSDETDAAVHANIVAAGYGSNVVSVRRDGTTRGVSHAIFRQNPSGRGILVDYDLARKGRVEMWLTDLQGRAIAHLAPSFAEAGAHRVAWEVAALPPGAYFARLDLDGRTDWTGAVALGD